jgi:GxxExxY protein
MAVHNSSSKRRKVSSEKPADELNDLSYRIIGIAIEVHKKLGPGFQEKIYEEALLKEFEKSSIEFEKQKVVRVDYDGFGLGNQRIDLLINGEIILEIKTCTKIIPIHRDQVISYLKTADKKLGLILNFGRSKLEIKRVVNNFQSRRDESPFFAYVFFSGICGFFACGKFFCGVNK